MMKKNLLMGALICASLAFTGCSSDDEPETIDWSNVLPTESYIGGNIAVTLNDNALSSGRIEFEPGNNNTATIELEDVIPGYEEVDVPVTLTQTGDCSYSFSGTTSLYEAPTMSRTVAASYAIYNVSASGTISGGKCSISVTSELTDNAKGALVGTWKLLDKGVPLADGSGYQSAPLMMTWSANDMSKPNMQAVGALAGAMGSPILFNLLQDVTFNADGNITSTYYALQDDEAAMDFAAGAEANADGSFSYKVVHQGSWSKSPKDLAFWYAHGDYIFVTPNLNAIFGVDDDDQLEIDDEVLRQYGIDEDAVEAVYEQWNKTGIPLKYAIDGNNLAIYVDKELAAPFIQMLLPTLPTLQKMYEAMAQEDPESAAMIQMFYAMITGSYDVDLTKLSTIWNENTKDFGISLNFTK